MKKVLAILSLVPLCAMGEMIPSGVTTMGGRGLLRLPSARTLSKGHLCVHLSGDYTSEPHTTIHRRSAQDSAEVLNRRHWGSGRIGLTYGVYDVLEFHLTSCFAGKYYQAVDEPWDWEDYRAIGFRDIVFGVKAGYPFFEREVSGVGLLGGLYAFVRSPTLSERPEEDSILVTPPYNFQPFLKKKAEVGGMILSDVELEAIRFHAGVGYLNAGGLEDESQTLMDSLALSAPESRMLWGIGSSVSIGPWVELFAEVAGRKIMDKPESVPDTAYLSPGVRFKSPLGTILELSGDYALVDGIPEWGVGISLSTTASLIPKEPAPPEPPALATLTGSVTDGETGEALIAEISFPEETEIGATSSAETGIYKKSLPHGKYIVQAEKEGYRWMRKVVDLEEGERKVVDFELAQKPEVAKGLLTGRVYDLKTEEPLIAQIKFPDSDVPPTASDKTGIYRVELMPGTHTVSVEAEGYTVLAEPVVIGDKETIVKNFALRAIPKKGERIVLRGIHFEFGKATITPDSYAILDKAAQVLIDNPNLKVEIGGHTDSVGSESSNMRLSLARANSVRAYLISTHSIDAMRLVTKGYGEAMPVADNKTKDGRAQNRRIEFLVIGD